ncbi:MAG: ATP-grasp domain-containing protein, partial [Alphaproteobacteria bacterium]
YVACRLGLPNDGLAAAQFTTNKRWMRERSLAAGIVQPEFRPCRSLEEAEAAVGALGLPVVIKPVDNRGAFGVTIVHAAGELAESCYHAVMHAHSREVLVERFVEGTHVTVDGCADAQGAHHNLAVASKTTIAGNKPVINEVVYPAEMPAGARDAVLEANSRVVRALGIRGGLTHSEYIVDRHGRPRLVEIANRGGGVLTSALIVPIVSGVDVLANLVSAALGEPFPVAPTPSTGVVMLRFFLFAPGRVKAIHGLEDASRIAGVAHVRLVIKPGDVLTPPDSAGGRHGFAILSGPDRAAIDRLLAEVVGAIKISYEG